MLAQAAGTGASAGAAAVSESDMSVVLLCGVEGVCSVLRTPICRWDVFVLGWTAQKVSKCAEITRKRQEGGGGFSRLQLLCSECELIEKWVCSFGLRPCLHVCACVCSWYVRCLELKEKMGER